MADADEVLDALVLIRALAEYALTLDWLALDPDLHVRIWIADGHRPRPSVVSYGSTDTSVI